jgi:D-alanyl-lipoteichoic acid acyltransferase DltB (MBOAT superfamily)
MFLSSLAFIIFVGDFGVLPYFLISIGVSWLGALLIERKANTQKQKDLLLFITIAILIIELTLKYAEFFIQPFIALTNHFGMSVCLDGISVIVPVGMAYFQLTLIGYVTDVYRSTCKAQLNILKHTLFTSWFPVLTCGPILRKSEMDDELFGVHHFNYQQLCFGLQRMIWGYFKKLIVADRLAIFVASVYSDVSQVAGVFIAIAAILFLLQLYCDFSGCIDIVLGVSQCFGVRLPENFRTPFFSKSIEEWWRRWHITLGAWSKDYLLYPLLKSSVFQTIGRFSKKILGK